MIFRPYQHERDRDACIRIWRECGWISPGKEEVADLYMAHSRGRVAEVNGEAECLVITDPGVIRYLDEDLSCSCVTGVTTSRVVRKQGIAGRLLAKALAEDASAGELTAALGMFEQGYYNQLGFGTGPYEFRYAFDPAAITVKQQPRVPKRLSVEDWEAVYASRTRRRRTHGGMNVLNPHHTRADMIANENVFGLGYQDDATGEWTHLLCGTTDNVEEGPYHFPWCIWRTPEQFRELMALIRTLGDQVKVVKLDEPAGIQLQDLVRQPIKARTVSRESKFELGMHALAYFQYRILDLPGCLARTHLPCEPVQFNLRLEDPIERLLDAESPWRGIGGDYVVTLGLESAAERGESAGLDTLSAEVGAFTRIWLGVRPATGLAITDSLSGPPELLECLDRSLRLPIPHPDWEF